MSFLIKIVTLPKNRFQKLAPHFLTVQKLCSAFSLSRFFTTTNQGQDERKMMLRRNLFQKSRKDWNKNLMCLLTKIIMQSISRDLLASNTITQSAMNMAISIEHMKPKKIYRRFNTDPNANKKGPNLIGVPKKRWEFSWL